MNNFFKFIMVLLPGSIFHVEVPDLINVQLLLVAKGYSLKTRLISFEIAIISEDKETPLVFEASSSLKALNTACMTYIGKL